ncbi:MAG TPA: hypothetical protein VJR29_00460 [bacterium]|nr:hypothetical protein [bacterium]
MPRKKNPDDEFLTRGVFKKELAELKADLKAELKVELKEAFSAFGKEMRLETRELLIDFYRGLVEPRFIKIEGELGGLRGEFDEFRHETLGRFDDLYKKFEDLRQEYVFTNHQLKGIDFRLERLEKLNKPTH